MEEDIKILEDNYKDSKFIKAIENLIARNKELEKEKEINSRSVFLANNQICDYMRGYNDGLHKEETAISIVARENKEYMIGQQIKILKDTINELHKKIEKGNEKVERDYIPKSKVKEKIKELEKIRKSMEKYLLVSNNSLNIQAIDEKIIVLQELLEE